MSLRKLFLAFLVTATASCQARMGQDIEISGYSPPIYYYPTLTDCNIAECRSLDVKIVRIHASGGYLKNPQSSRLQKRFVVNAHLMNDKPEKSNQELTAELNGAVINLDQFQIGNAYTIHIIKFDGREIIIEVDEMVRNFTQID